MTCRRGSTLAPLMEVCLPPATSFPILRRRLVEERLFYNENCLPPRFRPKPCRRRKSPHPHDLIPAYIPARNHRPQLALRLRHMTLLQQFLDLLGGLGMGRPESVSRTPVPHP